MIGRHGQGIQVLNQFSIPGIDKLIPFHIGQTLNLRKILLALLKSLQEFVKGNLSLSHYNIVYLGTELQSLLGHQRRMSPSSNNGRFGTDLLYQATGIEGIDDKAGAHGRDSHYLWLFFFYHLLQAKPGSRKDCTI